MCCCSGRVKINWVATSIATFPFKGYFMYYLIFLLLLSCGGPSGERAEDTFEAPPPEKPLPPIKPPARPGFVSPEMVVDIALLDAQSLDTSEERKDARYLNACDRYNAGEDMEEIAIGLRDGLNGLTQERGASPTAIGPGGCLFRIGLFDYKIDRVKWKKFIEPNLLLPFIGDEEKPSIRLQTLQFLTQTKLPVAYADDFLVTAYENDAATNKDCEVYCNLLDLPRNFNDFMLQQGVDTQLEYDLERVQNAGIGESPLSVRKDRLIELFKSNDGHCMTTLDSDLAAEQSMLENSFTLEAANAGGVVRSDKIFTADAREVLCPLRSGSYIHWLNGADGIVQMEAPTSVVRNVHPETVDGIIRPGDCTACHRPGQMAKELTDELGLHIATDDNYDSEEQNIGRIFYDSTKMQANFGTINRNHQAYHNSIGNFKGVDHITQTIMWPFRRRYDAVKVAGKVGMEVRDFLNALTGARESSQKLGILLTGGTVSAGTFFKNFPVLVEELNLFEDEDL